MFGTVSLLADFVYEGARSITGPLLVSLGATGLVVGVVTGIGEAAALGPSASGIGHPPDLLKTTHQDPGQDAGQTNLSTRQRSYGPSPDRTSTRDGFRR